MAEQHYATLGGVGCSRVRVYVPNGGVPFVDAWLPTADEVSGSVVLQIGETAIQCTVVSSGVYGFRRRVTAKVGAGGWGSEIPKLSYHNDAGVRSLTVARDAATAAGETLADDDFTPKAERLGNDYVHVAGRASKVLDGIADLWWVDYDGVTHVAPRPESTADQEKVTALDYDPQSGRLALAVDDVGNVVPGMSVAVDDQTVTIRSLQIDADSNSVSVTAWVRDAAERDRLGDLLRAIASRATDTKLTGSYEYKVVSMAAKRVNLEPVDPSSGAPALSAVSVWTAPGVSANLASGATVAVSFLDGNPAKPFVHACTPPDRDGHEPDRVDLGAPDGIAVARLGDTVSVLFPPVVPFSGTLSGAPIAGTMTLTVAATGVIQGGSSKVFTQ